LRIEGNLTTMTSKLCNCLLPGLLLVPVVFVCGVLLLSPVSREPEESELGRIFTLIGSAPTVNDHGFEVVNDHGWPWVFMISHEPVNALDHAILAFWYWPMLADVFVLLLLIATATLLLAWHRRQNGGWLRVTIRELMAVTAILSAALAWWMLNYNKHSRELLVADRNLSHGINIASEQYHGSAWLRRLAPTSMLKGFYRIDGLWISTDAPDDYSVHLENALLKLPHVKHIRVIRVKSGPLRISNPAAFAHVEALALEYRSADDETVQQLGKLSSLRRLALIECAIADENLANITNCAHLEALDLIDDSITDAGIAHLTKLPLLRELKLRSNSITASGLAPFAQTLRLQSLTLRCEGLTDNVFDTLVQMGSLEKLTLAKCVNLSNEGVRRLLELPNLTSVHLFDMPQISADTVGMLDHRFSNVFAGSLIL
jgi:hypothetical protein